MNFRLKNGETVRTIKAEKASGTVIAAGKMVGNNDANGILTEATGTTAAVAWCPNGAPAGTTEIEVSVGNDFTLRGTAENVFAKSKRATEVDLVISGSDQLINDDATSTKVFKISPASDAGVVGSTANVEFVINKPLF